MFYNEISTFARAPANMRVFAPRPQHFNLLIVNFLLGGDAGRKPQMAQISHHNTDYIL